MQTPASSSTIEHAACGRFIIGIDLGTTNCSLSYLDLGQEGSRLQQLDIPQLTAPGELGTSKLLPSFCYLPGPQELPKHSLQLPWSQDPQLAVGIFAREQGSRIPERLISSAKSWLAHAGVNRTQPILPWGGDLGDQMLSPIQAETHFLSHLKHAWDTQFGSYRDQDGTPCLLQHQQVIVTVPASFDESAREYTLQAARLAGIQHVTLIEEPLAAFYSWLANHQKSWKELAHPGDVIAVVDVGGGTSDFSLIEIDQDYTLRRKAVGSHLLLGGDNMDMALAHQAETAWKTKLPQRLWSKLCQECRKAKEILLAPNAPESHEIKLAGLGSSLVGSLKVHRFTREDVWNLLVQGFFPLLTSDAAPPSRRQGVQEMGLPYAADPTITRHLLQFLRDAGPSLSTPQPLAKPNKVLFNGGALLPEAIRNHILRVMEAWTQSPIQELAPTDFSLAVSEGAAYYGLARRGKAVRVKGGIANAYFLEIGRGQDSTLVCVMPRDTAEGVVCKLPFTFSLQTNTPVAFPLHASATRLGDRLGDLVQPGEDMTPLPPLRTALRFGRKEQAVPLEVTLEAKLNEIGTLDLACQSTATPHRFPLTFELRDTDTPRLDEPDTVTETVDEHRMQQALQYVAHTFTQPSDQLQSIMPQLEEILGLSRQEWSAVLLRHIADLLLQHQTWRTQSPQHEARWLNVMGFCLRPGCGVVGDAERIRSLWKLWHQGTVAPSFIPALTNWSILWRRVAPGLSSGQQNQIAGALARELVTKDQKTVIKKDDAVRLETWRLLAVLEKVPVQLKLKCLTALIRGTGKLHDQAFWPMARLGARNLFAGTHDTVIPADRLLPLIKPLLQKVQQANAPKNALLTLAAMAQFTGIRTLDLPDTTREQLRTALKDYQVPEADLKQLDTPVQQQQNWSSDLLGDSLPLGLTLDSQD